jgi:head-tail adaptor
LPDNPSGQLGASNGIGSLRWRVTLYRRDQTPDPGLGIKETLVPIATVQADIQPTYPSTFYNAVAVDIPVSHMIRCRWLDYVENTHVIMRSTLRAIEQRPATWDQGVTVWDDGASPWDDPRQMATDQRQRTELFRVRRIKEVAGRKRFVEFECELERAHTTYSDSDTTRQSEFMEPTIVGEPPA